jgi:nitrite reductase/ring-hydroxylating ferredoxin subunit
MENFVKVLTLTELPAGTSKTCRVNGKEVGIYNVGGKIYACENTCFHQGAPLADGRLDGQVITCPWHSWKYDVTTGVCTRDDSVTLKTYKVKVEGEDILIQI